MNDEQLGAIKLLQIQNDIYLPMKKFADDTRRKKEVEVVGLDFNWSTSNHLWEGLFRSMTQASVGVTFQNRVVKV